MAVVLEKCYSDWHSHIVVDADAELDCSASFGFENGPGGFTI